jgi:ribonuclease P protein component
MPRRGAREAMIKTDACGPGDGRSGTKAPAATRLRRRADFQRAARGHRSQTHSFTLQSLRRPDGAPQVGVRFGLTVTRKVGNAVVRNRIRRRLKEALRLASGLEARADHDYVLVARIEALARPFDLLMNDLARALRAAHTTGAKPGGRPRSDDRERLR